MAGVLLSDDLIFTSRIVGTARDLGLEVKPARTIEQLEKLTGEKAVSCLILDLQHPELKIADVVASFKKKGGNVVAYGSHVAADVLHAAREAGCDVVWPRSKFVEELVDGLRTWLGPDTTRLGAKAQAQQDSSGTDRASGRA